MLNIPLIVDLQRPFRLGRDEGLREIDILILWRILYFNPKPVSYHARALGMTQQGMRSRVKTLQEKGLTKTTDIPGCTDSRMRAVILTDKGKDLIRHLLGFQEEIKHP